MEYYEFHYLVKELIEHMKRESDSNKGQQEQSSDMMGSMKMPNMKMPSMKMPKM
jgi:hypothetical protein|tara:strand:- start:614 stop:775 length:162 start_codon:yes stop_codon:yes gene_type:complete